MGSTLTLVNDTPFDWLCEVRADAHALKMTVLTAAGVASIGTVTGIWSAYLMELLGFSTIPELSVTLHGFATVGTLKRAAKAAETSGFLSATAASMTGFITNLIGTIDETYRKKGYEKIKSGTSRTYGKMRILSRREAKCVRVYQSSTYDVRVERVTMRPIYSGSLWNDGHNVNHSISEWIHKKGVETEDIQPRKGQLIGRKGGEEIDSIGQNGGIRIDRSGHNDSSAKKRIGQYKDRKEDGVDAVVHVGPSTYRTTAAIGQNNLRTATIIGQK